MPSRSPRVRVRRAAEPPAPRPKLKRTPYERELESLQGELVKLQYWVKATRAKLVIVFEGRDGAGKGGVIKRLTERVSPRVFRVEALPAPDERERSQMYMQRYIARLPAGGEVVIFDRSWYNRLGVERVMGFCTDQEYRAFLHDCPWHEAEMIESGILLRKYWLEVSMEEQARRFRERMTDPRKLWKLGAIDLEAHRRWWDYTRAKEAMFARTDTAAAPWYVVQADDQRRARVDCLRHLLSTIPYTDLTADAVPDRLPRRRPRDPGHRSSGHLYRWVGGS